MGRQWDGKKGAISLCDRDNWAIAGLTRGREGSARNGLVSIRRKPCGARHWTKSKANAKRYRREKGEEGQSRKGRKVRYGLSPIGGK